VHLPKLILVLRQPLLLPPRAAHVDEFQRVENCETQSVIYYQDAFELLLIIGYACPQYGHS